MSAKYGYPETEWEDAKEEMRRILVQTASHSRTIAYSDLVCGVHTIRLQPDSHALAHMLGEISTEEDTAGRGMLSVVVVHKGGDQKPGPGFFELAKKLGRDTSDVLKCWIQELRQVHDYWRSHPVPK